MNPHNLIFLWCVPRSVSTAFEKMMDNGGQFKTYGEPFIDLYKQSLLSQRDAQQAKRAFQKLCSDLLAESQIRPVFVKDMAYHALPFISKEVICSATHAFLTRDPRLSIPSLYRMRPEFTEDQPGFEGQYQLLLKVKKRTGPPLFLMDAEQLKINTKRTIEDFFTYIGADMPPDILTWPKGSRAQWKGRESWHLDAINSEGFANHRTHIDLTGLPDRVLDSIERNLPVYEKITSQITRW